jgi:hypothetical protein
MACCHPAGDAAAGGGGADGAVHRGDAGGRAGSAEQSQPGDGQRLGGARDEGAVEQRRRLPAAVRQVGSELFHHKAQFGFVDFGYP